MMAVPVELGYAVAGKYVVERELGRGGMGAVYAVTHKTTGKRMAMKCLLPQLVYDGELVGRFMREAKVMGRLNHRHIVDLFDVGRDGDVLFIVMELLEGRPLSLLLGDAAMTLEETLVILLRAMEGVAAAHAHGVIHRDLKPDNIFVCTGASGRLDDPRVLDFGISRLDEPSGPQLTRTGVAMGTPYYMAYEQLSGQRDLDARVDVYAMGVVLYEAIAGTPPFVGESLSAVAVRMLTSEPADLAALRPDLPRGLAAVIMRAISRQRDARPPDMRALIDDLHPFVPRGAWSGEPSRQPLPLRRLQGPGSTPFESAIRARESSLPARAPSLRDRRTRVGAALAALLLAGGGLGYVLVDSPVAATRKDVPRMPQPLATQTPPDVPSADAPPPAPADVLTKGESEAVAPATQGSDAGVITRPVNAGAATKSKWTRASVRPLGPAEAGTPRSAPGDAGTVSEPKGPPASPLQVPAPQPAPQPPAPQPSTESSNRAGKLTPQDF